MTDARRRPATDGARPYLPTRRGPSGLRGSHQFVGVSSVKRLHRVSLLVVSCVVWFSKALSTCAAHSETRGSRNHRFRDASHRPPSCPPISLPSDCPAALESDLHKSFVIRTERLETPLTTRCAPPRKQPRCPTVSENQGVTGSSPVSPTIVPCASSSSTRGGRKLHRGEPSRGNAPGRRRRSAHPLSVPRPRR